MSGVGTDTKISGIPLSKLFDWKLKGTNLKKIMDKRK